MASDTPWIDYDPRMSRARLSSRQLRVLTAISKAQDVQPSGSYGWISGYDVFVLVRAAARFGAANHGTVFNSLRRLSAQDYVRVRVEQLPGGAGHRATYRLTDRGMQESLLAGQR